MSAGVDRHGRVTFDGDLNAKYLAFDTAEHIAKEADASWELVKERGNEALKSQNTALLHQFKTSIAVKFRNLSDKVVLLWYDDGASGVNQAKMNPGSDATTNSYPGHKFCFTREFAVAGCRDALHSHRAPR